MGQNFCDLPKVGGLVPHFNFGPSRSLEHLQPY